MPAAIVVAAALISSSPAQSASKPPAPFLNFRSRVLEYTGPDTQTEVLAEIRIGWFGPSDATNSAARAMWWAASFAVHEANVWGGYQGRPFRLLPCWSANPWGTGVSQLARMVYEDHPVALVGGIDSASTHLAEQVVAKAQLPLLSPVATDKTATLAGVPWMFSCAPSDAAIAHALAEELVRTLQTGANRLALLSSTDHESRMTAREVVRELSARGRLPDFRFEFPPGAAAMDRQLVALAESRAGIVLIIASAADAARLVVGVRKILPEAQLFGSHQMGRAQFRELAGANADGVCFPNLFLPVADDEHAARFTKEFQAVHHCAPDYTAALTYDATRLLLEAVRRAGPSRTLVREALIELSPWQGVSGLIRFDGTGQNVQANIALGTIGAGAVAQWKPTTADLHASRNEHKP